RHREPAPRLGQGRLRRHQPGDRHQAQRPGDVPDGRPGDRRRAVPPHPRGRTREVTTGPMPAGSSPTPYPGEEALAMDQPRILMCRPDYYGIEYEINPWMDRKVASDPSTSLGQWLALRDTLLGLGVRVETLDPVAGLPDLVFTANAGLVF